MQQVDKEKNATNLLNFNQMAVKTIENKTTTTTMLSKNVDTKQSEQPLIQDQRVLFLIEFCNQFLLKIQRLSRMTVSHDKHFIRFLFWGILLDFWEI